MNWECQLVHAEQGRRVVQVRAQRNGQLLGSALGEGTTAEEAEDRAIQRLAARLKPATPEAPPATSPPASAPAASKAPAPTKAPSSAPAQAPAQAAAQAPSKIAADTIAEPSLPAIPARASNRAIEESSEGVPAPGNDPEDWSTELARLDLQLQRLGWSRDQEGVYLERAFGHPSRNRLTHYGDLLAYLNTVETLAPGADPSTANVPLRRRDLLGQCDQLLAQLQWDAATGRSFLEQHFSLTSRQQLSDSQLLQFNMLLEGALMGL